MILCILVIHILILLESCLLLIYLADTNPNTSGGFRHVSVGRNNVWAVTNSGFICRRCGITSENPAGTGWDFGIGVS